MPGKPRIDMSAIRKYAAERVDQTSFRAVADEIGMSKSGLQAFLQGREPYSTTRPKLIDWYVRSRHSGGRINADEIQGAIALLRQHIEMGGPLSEHEERATGISLRLFGRKP